MKRIKKSPRWDNDEGVAATVGTIMALLVFLAFMGIFTNQFVPVWMSDNESTHMTEAIGQLVTLKSQIDSAVAQFSNSLVAPSPIFVPVTLSSAGIPVFAAGTSGVLTLSPDISGSKPTFEISYVYSSETNVPNVGNVTYNYNLADTSDGHAGGYLELYCPNRYYVEEHLVYEGGAIILNQSDGEFVIAGLQMSVKNMGTSLHPSRVMQITQVTITGANKTIGGTGSKGVTAQMISSSTMPLTNSGTYGDHLTITIVSSHGTAWEQYFERALSGQAGMTSRNGFNITTSLVQPKVGDIPAYYSITVILDNIKVLDHTRATVTMGIGELGV